MALTQQGSTLASCNIIGTLIFSKTNADGCIPFSAMSSTTYYTVGTPQLQATCNPPSGVIRKTLRRARGRRHRRADQLVQQAARWRSRAPARRRTRWRRRPSPATTLCLTQPSRGVDLTVSTTPRTMAEIWLGDTPFATALQHGTIELDGPRALAHAFPRWLELSMVAAIERVARRPAAR